MTILVGYIRVSGESQRDNTSLPAQRQAITEFCKGQGHQLWSVFEDVQSAEDASSRQGLQCALQVIFSGLADGLIVHKMDRMCRKVIDSEQIKQRFLASGKLLMSATDQIDIESDNGNLLYQVQNAIQEYERRKIKERCVSGQKAKKAANGYHSGTPPFGYDAVARTLRPNPAEQEVLHLIFELRRGGQTIAGIAAELNARGIGTKRGKKWGNQQVYTILCDFPVTPIRMGLAPDFLTA